MVFRYVAVAAFVVGALFFSSTVVVSAQAMGGGPHPVCVAWVQQCQKGKCPPPPPCTTSVCTGVCSNVMCMGEGQCTQGDGSSDPSGGKGAEQMMQMAQKMLEQLMKGGGGEQGGGGGGQPPGGGQPQQPQGTANELLDSIYKNLGTTGSTTTLGTTTTATTTTGTSTATTTRTTTTPTTTVTLVNNATRTSTTIDRTTVSTSTPTTAGSILSRATQAVGSLFGTSAAPQGSYLNRLCEKKPWTSGMLSKVFSTSFFNSLCEKRVSAVVQPRAQKVVDDAAARARITCTQEGTYARIAWNCGAGVRSGGVGFTTNGESAGTVAVLSTTTKQFILQCANGSTSSCVSTAEGAELDLVASPTIVTPGGRTKLFWSAKGVSSCVVEGLGMKETGLKGAAVTPTVYDTSVFTLTCIDTDGGTIKKQVTVTL